MFIAIIAISYFLAINIFGFRIVKIQRDDRKKNGEPTPQPQVIKQLENGEKSKGTYQSESSEEKMGENVSETREKTHRERERANAKNGKNAKSGKTRENDLQSPQPHNGDKIQKDTLLAEEKLNLKRYERIPDLKILMVALFGGAFGEYIAFLILKYRTTNTILMVGLPVLIALWVYLYYIVAGRVFFV